MTRRSNPWRNPEVGDIVVTRASGDGHGPARRREVTGVTERSVEYDDGRLYSKWIRGEGWKRRPGASCVRSSWATWCSKHAVEYWRADVDMLLVEELVGHA